MALINEIKEREANLAEEEKLEGEVVAQDLLKKKRQLSLWMTQEETKLQDQLERGELTHEHRENLNKEHSIRLWLQERSLQQEIEQIEKDQEVKWKRKKDDGQQRIAERKAQEEQKAEASHSQQVRQLLNKATKAFVQMARFTARNFPVLHLKPRPILEKNFAKLLLQVPLFKLLGEINKHLKANQEAKMDHQGTNQSKVKYEEKGRPYIDAVDAEFTCEGNLVPLTPEKISVTELAVYRFGIYIVQRVKKVINAPEIKLLLASSLPQNNYTHNTFRNSFFYQHSQNTLFIRRQRLASVGDFSLLLVHCLAHLAAGQLSDDSDTLFLKFFHQALKFIFKETFFTRLNVSPTLCAHEPTGSPWHNLFQTEDCLGVHTDAISDLLNIKLEGPKSLADFEKEDREIKKDNRASTQSKDQQSETMNGYQSQMERNNDCRACFESRSELDLRDVQEKIDDLTMELAVLLDLEQKGQDRAISQRKAFLFKEIEELEAELDRKEN
ncbi:uncharacterized protein [Hemitrygon akajei]|uniref:uncharacterized protein n=1 Tax=Hemitrygon akajei TaxID=2704970 RepID=UPI003BF9BEF6